MEKPTRISISNIDNDLPFWFSVTSKKMMYLLMQRLSDYEITPDQWLVLSRIHDQEGMLEKEIAEITYKDRSTTARIIDALVAKAFVIKENNKRDRRSFLIYVTEKGKTLIEQTVRIERQTHDGVVSGIRSTEYELLTRLLHQMNDNMDKMRE